MPDRGGTGSNPPLENGWHLRMRHTVNMVPLKKP